jgi:hypothetical protein
MVSKERQTANTLVTAFNSMDIDTISALRTPNCQRVFLPSSLGYAPQSNYTYHASLMAMKSIFTSFHITVNDVIEETSDSEWSEEGRKKKIVMYVTARGDTAVGEYKNEYVWKMAFEDGGKRICEWSEFVDVGVSRDFMPKLKAGVAMKMAWEQGDAGCHGVKENLDGRREEDG